MEFGARVAPGPGHRVRPTRPPILKAALRFANSKHHPKRRRASRRRILRRVFAPAWFGGRCSRNIALHTTSSPPTPVEAGFKVRIFLQYLQNFGFFETFLKPVAILLKIWRAVFGLNQSLCPSGGGPNRSS